MIKERKDIIIDTDLGADCDDCVALALAINLHNQGLLNVKAITISSTRDYAQNTLNAILDYYHFDCLNGQMSLPAIEADQKDSYCYLFKDYANNRESIDAVKLLRKTLAESKKKISVAAIGPLTNIARLISSEADEYSSLDGLSLIKSKVEAFYIMGGTFTHDFAEWNVKSDVKSAKEVFEKVEVPIYISPFELGERIKTGDSLVNQNDSPVSQSIKAFFDNNDKQGCLVRESWDPLTILAVTGYKHIKVMKQGIVTIDDKGITSLQEGDGNRFILESTNDKELEKYINGNILLRNKGQRFMEKETAVSKKELEIQKRNNAKVLSIIFPSDIDKNNNEHNFITLKNINKIYDNDVQAVFDFNLNINKNEFIVLVGPSGCGKSTTLRMIAGLEEITSGELFINSVYSNELAAKNRDIAMVFQTYALYPHMTVYNNLAFGIKIRKFPTLVKDKEGNDVLWIDKKAISKIKKQIKDCDEISRICEKEIEKLKVIEGDEDEKYIAEKKINYYSNQQSLASQKKESLLKDLEAAETTMVPKYVLKHLPREEIDRRVNEAARILEIEGYLNRKPRALSGGQRQRVALGRAIVRNSSAFLMDEPLSNLDAKLRVQMRSEIVNIHRKVGATTIYVTHDQTEAMTMADRIVVMKDGMVQQIGTPIDIYSHPKNLFVAQFIGAPAMNVIEGRYNGKEIDFGDNKQVLKDAKEKIKQYYEQEIARLNEVRDNMNEMLRDKKHPKYHIFEMARDEASALIDNYQEKINSMNFDVLLGIRPEDVALASSKKENVFEVKADMVELLGSEYFVHTEFAGQKFVFKTGNDKVIKTGDNVLIEFKMDKIHLFDVDSKMSIF